MQRLYLFTHQLKEACFLSDEIYEMRGLPAYLTRVANITRARTERNDKNIQNIKEEIMFQLRQKNVSPFTRMGTCPAGSGVNEFVKFLQERGWKIYVLDKAEPLKGAPPDLIILDAEHGNATKAQELYANERTRFLWLSPNLCKHSIKATGITGDFQSLKDWWGWENLYQDLIAQAPIALNTKVEEVIIGHNWSYVKTKDGVGLGRTPCRGTEGARTIASAGEFIGKNVKELAQWLSSDDDLARSVAIASLSSAYNNKAKGRTGETEWGLSPI